MKKFIKFLSMFLLICTLICALGACDLLNKLKGTPDTTQGAVTEEPEWVDYADQLKLDLTTSTLK